MTEEERQRRAYRELGTAEAKLTAARRNTDRREADISRLKAEVSRMQRYQEKAEQQGDLESAALYRQKREHAEAEIRRLEGAVGGGTEDLAVLEKRKDSLAQEIRDRQEIRDALSGKNTEIEALKKKYDEDSEGK